MKLFISWSGERSKQLAIALKGWIPLILQYVEPWVSDSDIQAGERWSHQIAEALEASKFGIICTTRENLNLPWLLFEAGALAKSMEDGKVVPLLLDLDLMEVSGPLAQFQGKKADEAGICDILVSLNKSALTPMVDDKLNQLFQMAWPSLKSQIESISSSTGPIKRKRPESEILEELVSSVRNVELRFRDIDEVGNTANSTTRLLSERKYSPKLLHDFKRSVSDKSNDPIHVVIISSFLKDDLPWLYELCLELFKTEETSEYLSLNRKLQRIIERLLLTKYLEEMTLQRNVYHFLKALQEHLEESLSRIEEDDIPF